MGIVELHDRHFLRVYVQALSHRKAHILELSVIFYLCAASAYEAASLGKAYQFIRQLLDVLPALLGITLDDGIQHRLRPALHRVVILLFRCAVEDIGEIHRQLFIDLKKRVEDVNDNGQILDQEKH